MDDVSEYRHQYFDVMWGTGDNCYNCYDDIFLLGFCLCLSIVIDRDILLILHIVVLRTLLLLDPDTGLSLSFSFSFSFCPYLFLHLMVATLVINSPNTLPCAI